MSKSSFIQVPVRIGPAPGTIHISSIDLHDAIHAFAGRSGAIFAHTGPEGTPDLIFIASSDKRSFDPVQSPPHPEPAVTATPSEQGNGPDESPRQSPMNDAITGTVRGRVLSYIAPIFPWPKHFPPMVLLDPGVDPLTIVKSQGTTWQEYLQRNQLTLS